MSFSSSEVQRIVEYLNFCFLNEKSKTEGVFAQRPVEMMIVITALVYNY